MNLRQYLPNSALLCHFTHQLIKHPATSIFMCFGWMLAALLTLVYGQLIANNVAGLELLFGYLPWVLCLLIPALTMGVADERRRGVEERLNTLPFTPLQRVLGRFTVHWLLLGLWLLGLWPLLATILYLGSPDLGPIFTGFIGTWLFSAPLLAASLFAAYRAPGSVGGFLFGFALCAALTMLGAPSTVEWLSRSVPTLLASPLVGLLQMATPYAALTRFIAGFVTLGALLFLIGTTVAFLGAAVGFSTPPKRWGLPTLMTLAGAVIILISLIPPLPRTGWDATHDDLHTLSPATVQMLEKLPAPITFTFYHSRNNPDIPPSVHANAQALRDLLARIRNLNPSKIRVVEVNPDRDISTAMAALQVGMTEQVLPSGTGFFSGLAAQTNGKISLIRTLSPARRPFLEFDLMSLITEATRTHKPNLQLLTSISVDNPAGRPRWMGELGTAYNMETTELDTSSLPENTDLLLVVGTPTVTDNTLNAIATYLKNGGRMVWLADPFWRTKPQQQVIENGTRTLAELFEGYGIKVDSDHVVGDMALATPVAQEKTGYTAYPFWLSLGSSNLNPQTPFAAFVSQMLLAEAGPIEATNLAKGLTFTPLITTTDHAQLVSSGIFTNTPAELLASKLTGPTAPQTLAALITGSFGEGAKPATVLIVNDVDWLANNFALQVVGQSDIGTPPDVAPINDNLTLFYNALQYTLGETGLIELRGKAVGNRTLTRIESLLDNLTRHTTMLEQQLAERLYAVSEKLQQLQDDKASAAEMSTVQSTEMAGYLRQQFELRQQLRNLRQQVRQQLSGLQTAIVLFNLFLMPTLLTLGLYLRARRRDRK